MADDTTCLLRRLLEYTPTFQSFRLRGRVYEALAAKASEGETTEGSEPQTVSLKKSALEAYKRSIELDLSQKDLILQVCNLMLDLPTDDPERTR